MESKKEKYQKKDPIQHILDRPDMYVGSLRSREVEEYIYDSTIGKIIRKKIQFSPALLRIFIEPLSNAIDNVEVSIREKIPCTKIDIILSNNEISIMNNGNFIPIEKNKEGDYYHSMIFGQLLTSSNYDDDEERLVSGRNGIGIKATNCFSSKFYIEGVDPTTSSKLIQEWGDNMKIVSSPKITPSKLIKGYTLIKWTADFSRFNIKEYSIDILNLYKKYIYDAAFLTKIDVSLNGEIIRINSLRDYARLYLNEEPKEELYYITKGKYNTEIYIIPSEKFDITSFVNGIYTINGGTHTQAWIEALLRPIVEKYNKKVKTTKINIKDVKNLFRIFINAKVVNPEFDSQEKKELMSPRVIAEFPSTKINILMKWENTKRLDELIKHRELSSIDKIIRTRSPKIPGLDNANFSGGKRSNECTLIVCEGLSAKSTVVGGIHTAGIDGKKGKDFFGILPVRGKLLNVRGSSPAMIAKNQVITNIIQAFGFRQNVDYTIDKWYNSLNYGRMMIMCDQDHDGVHISSLIINIIHYLFPSLIKRNPSFILSMQTPILKIFLTKTKQIVFYNEGEYRKFINKNSDKKYNVRYYKGLGSSETREIKETFGKKILYFKDGKNVTESLDKAFGKNTDIRKEWLLHYFQNKKNIIDPVGNEEGIKNINISDYIDKKLVEFSEADCKRSLPNIYDGLKESQRKILYTCFSKNYDTKLIKVAQLGGITSGFTSYHHGEDNLQQTIIKMAQCFVGSNNIPLLYRGGQFGSRLADKDAASPRYIFTKLECLTRLLFRKEDIPLYRYLNDDGENIEPEYYLPILPTVLINGSVGIGTGWSCDIPCFNPLDLINCVKLWLKMDGKNVVENKDNLMISSFPEISPWYRGFKGEIIKEKDNYYTSHGIIEKYPNGKLVIELPVGKWIDSFTETLEDLREKKIIKKFENHSTPFFPYFIIVKNEEEITSNILKLYSHIRTTNMVLFSDNGILTKFETIDEIIDTFCKKRYELYTKRKGYLIDLYNDNLKWISNKRRFLEEVMNETLILRRRDEDDIINELEERGYAKYAKYTKKGEELIEENEGKYSHYKYLLSIPVRNFSKQMLQKLDKEINEIQMEISLLEKSSEKDIWLREIDEFEKNYLLWLKDIEKEENSIPISMEK